MKYISLIIIIKYILQFTYCNNESIQIPITFNEKHSDIYLKAQIGINSIDKTFKVDLKSFYSIIIKSSSYNDEICHSLSIISKSKSISIQKNYFVYGSYSFDSLKLSNLFESLRFYFLYVYDIDYAKEAIDTHYSYLSFARTNSSFQSQLASSQVISKRIVHFTNGSLLIGQLNKTIISSSHKSGRCSTVKIENYWACNLKGISIGSVIPADSPQIELNDTLVFDSFAEEIKAPYHIVSFFKEKFFEKELFQKFCSLSEDYIELRIVCDQEYARLLPPLIFYLDNIAFILNKDYLVESSLSNTPRLDFKILFKKDQSYWSFDNKLLMRYSIALNEEDNSVMFYSNNDDDLIVLHHSVLDSFSNKSMKNCCLIASLFTAICGSLLLFVVKYKLIKD